jgi:hypothetical protein
MSICLFSLCKAPLLTLACLSPSFSTIYANISLRGTSAHAVKVFNLDGVELSRAEPYTSYINFNQARTTPITATAFHPHRMMLGCAAKGDWHINLYHCGNEKVGGAVG